MWVYLYLKENLREIFLDVCAPVTKKIQYIQNVIDARQYRQTVVMVARAITTMTAFNAINFVLIFIHPLPADLMV